MSHFVCSIQPKLPYRPRFNELIFFVIFWSCFFFLLIIIIINFLDYSDDKISNFKDVVTFNF